MQNKKLKLLIVYDVSYPSIEGGGQRRFYEIASRLNFNYEFEVDWLCFKTWDSKIKSSNINYIGLPGFKGLYNRNGKRRFLEPLEFLFALYKNKTKYHKYDVIWAGQWPILHLIFWSYNKKIRSKLFVDWWEVWGRTWFSYSRFFGWIGFFVEKIVLKRLLKFSKLITISSLSKNRLANLAVNKKNLALINNGINTKKLNTISFDTKKIYDVGYLGRLQKHKRVDLLISSIKYIENQHGLKLRLLIIGDGPERAKLENLSKRLGLIDRVIFKGSISSNEEAYKTLCQCKIFVNPSTKEGGGSITTFEAFALGLPAVAFKCDDGVDPLIIGDKDRGILVEKICKESLGNDIFRLLIDSVNLNRMSNNAINYSKSLDWDTISKNYMEFFLNQ